LVGLDKVTTLPGVAVPDTVGVKLVTTLRGATMLTVGGAKAVKLVTLGVLVPPWLLATAVTEVTPGLTVTTHEKLPPAVAVVEHRVALPGPLIVTTLPGVAVPDTTGLVEVCVLLGDWIATVGAPTAVNVVRSATLTPPAFWDTAVIEVTPELTVTTHEYEPEAVAVVEHRTVLLAPVRVTRLPGVAVPDTVGVKLVTTLRGDTMLTVGGARAVNVVTSATLAPPAFREMAVIELTPAATVTTHE
jgi:major membrane immunogen (membrane-anchored lipoprotein)